jgi:acyl-CoA thioesterase I
MPRSSSTNVLTVAYLQKAACREIVLFLRNSQKTDASLTAVRSNHMPFQCIRHSLAFANPLTPDKKATPVTQSSAVTNRSTKNRTDRRVGHHIGSVELIRNCVMIGVALMLGVLGSSPMHAAEPNPPIRIAAFGDSLSAGYQLAPDQSFPAQLDKALKAKGYRVEVFNAAVSGDTTSAGLDRLAWAIPDTTDAVIVEFGGNDALRGLAPKDAFANLDAMITKLKAQKAEVLLAGMKAPRNLGQPYVDAFDSIYPTLAAKHNVLLHPFFVERIALKPEFGLPDGIHPNAKGVAEIVADIMPYVEKLIERVTARRAATTKG